MSAAYERAARDRRRARQELLTIPYCPYIPTATQARFLLDLSKEALYGGAAGGGKSIAMLMAALQFIDVPGYSALILRRSVRDLELPGGLIDVSRKWLDGHARFSEQDHTWYFPNGAQLVFGYLDHPADLGRYYGTEFHFIGLDELTQFEELPYRILFSRLRGPSDPNNPLSQVPRRVRATTNPTGPGLDWVKSWFYEPWRARGGKNADGPRFYPARINDNPHLDIEDYKANLRMLPPLERAQLLDGDWDVRPDGGVFKREWFKTVDPREVPPGLEAVRSWDLAATEPRLGSDPDYTVGVRVERDYTTGIYYVTDVQRFRGTAGEVESLVARTARLDTRDVRIVMEEEPGSAGKSLLHRYRTAVLPEYAVRSERPTGSKVTRSYPVASKAEAGELAVVHAPWVSDLLDEIAIFPQGRHDDQVDALCQGINWLATHSSGPVGPIVDLTAGLRRPADWEYEFGEGSASDPWSFGPDNDTIDITPY